MNEAVACVREGIVADADLCDAGVILALVCAAARRADQYLKNFGKDKIAGGDEALGKAHGARFKVTRVGNPFEVNLALNLSFPPTSQWWFTEMTIRL